MRDRFPYPILPYALDTINLSASTKSRFGQHLTQYARLSIVSLKFDRTSELRPHSSHLKLGMLFFSDDVHIAQALVEIG